jgi:hypothetical protein
MWYCTYETILFFNILQLYLAVSDRESEYESN